MTPQEIEQKRQLNREQIRKQAIEAHEKFKNPLPAGDGEIFDMTHLKADGFDYYRLVPRYGFNGTYIVYLYGSVDMSGNITEEHWRFLVQLLVNTGCGLFVPYYPLAPTFYCKDVFRMLQRMYIDATRSYDVERVVLMGDSAGAGLALSLAIMAWKNGLRKPDQMVFLSPILDTEYFDREIEKQIIYSKTQDLNYYYSLELKEYLNTYWVKDYVARTEYTSPFYEDYTDLCDDIAVLSGNADLYAPYATNFCKKAKAQGLNIRYFEFEGETHNFMIHSETETKKNAYRYLLDIINHTYKNSLRRLYPLKVLSDFTKRYPEVIRDPWASKFIYENGIKFDGEWAHRTEYEDIMLASTQAMIDNKVRRYMMQFPNCTVVHFGCRLSSMFRRLDNGRVSWYSVDSHNIMSVRRAIYGVQDREKTISRATTDFSWVDNIECSRNKGILFVCDDSFAYMHKHQVQDLVFRIWKRFPGAEIIIASSTTGSTFAFNRKNPEKLLNRRKKVLYVNDEGKMFSDWRTEFRVLSEEPASKGLNKIKDFKFKTRLGLWYNRVSLNQKVLHIKLGNEAYDTKL